MTDGGGEQIRSACPVGRPQPGRRPGRVPSLGPVPLVRTDRAEEGRQRRAPSRHLLPHWTFDAHTETDYTGQRGEAYYETHTRTVSDGNGNSHAETYTERKIRWYPASGHVRRDFDDILVSATTQIKPDKLEKMGPWPPDQAHPFQREYLTRFSALRYDVDPPVGAREAQAQMASVITADVRHDIGGDEQRIGRMNVAYSAQMFKLVLLPLWLATFVYGGQQWQVMVNANTGEVHGDRPWSKVELAIASLLAAIALTVHHYFAQGANGSGSYGAPAPGYGAWPRHSRT